MTFELFKWSLAIASLCGVVLNIRKRRECFYVWAGTNAAWTIVDAVHQIWSQAALQAVYFCLALWGAWSWRDRAVSGTGN
jgi:nicotinamide riboside transporter PnuC